MDSTDLLGSIRMFFSFSGSFVGRSVFTSPSWFLMEGTLMQLTRLDCLGSGLGWLIPPSEQPIVFGCR